MHDVFDRLYRTKLLLSSLVLVVLGIWLITLGKHFDQSHSWIDLLPWSEIGGILVGAGLLSVWLDRFLQREQSAIDDLRLRQLFREEAPAMRDAVLEAFAANHEDLVRVATPELLDQIITNSLALRLDDAQFASEIYTDIRDQAVGASERWFDASVSIDLSPLTMVRGTASGGTPSRTSSQYFAVTVRWTYTTVPHHAQRRFVCVSDRQEYAELAQERGATSAWYLKPADGIDVASREAFELVQFTVDGEDRPIRRAVRKHGQIYTANVGAEQIKAGEPVTISYTYRTITTQAGHLLFFDIEQPTRDIEMDFDYSDCGIAAVSALDLIPSVRPTRIERTPTSLPGQTIRVQLDGWVFPRSGVAFVWVLDKELAGASRSKGRARAS